MDVFDNFFARCGVPWKRGDYHRTDFGLNEAAGRSVLPAGAGAGSVAFPPSFSIKALHVQGARAEEKLYVPVSEARMQSAVFSPERVDESQAAVVGTKMGDGFLAYCGDVNGEVESSRVILALCGF